MILLQLDGVRAFPCRLRPSGYGFDNVPKFPPTTIAFESSGEVLLFIGMSALDAHVFRAEFS